MDKRQKLVLQCKAGHDQSLAAVLEWYASQHPLTLLNILEYLCQMRQDEDSNTKIIGMLAHLAMEYLTLKHEELKEMEDETEAPQL